MLSILFINSPEEILPVRSAYRYIPCTDVNTVIPDRVDLIDHYNKGLVYPCMFAGRQLLFDGLHAQFGKNRLGASRQMDLDIIPQSLYIGDLMQENFR